MRRLLSAPIACILGACSMFVPVNHYVVPTTMIDVLNHLGLTSSLVLTLDAGDPNSYSSGQTWTDVSGQGNSFYRGGTSGSDGTDPTFNGVAGGQSANEYFSGDGGDAFWQASALTFMQGWHKDNATFSVVAWVWQPSGTATNQRLLRNAYDFTTSIGTSVSISRIAGNGNSAIQTTNGAGGGNLFSHPTLDTMVEGSWLFVGISFAEGTGASFSRENGFVELFSSDTYVAPSASNAPMGVAIWGSPNAAGTGLEPPVAPPSLYDVPSNGSRINSLMAWNRALSQAEMLALYNATKTKFGL